MLLASLLCSLSFLAFVAYFRIIWPSLGQTDEDGGPSGALGPGPFPYIIEETNKCSERQVFLVLLITVEAHQLDRRDAIRRTWGDEGQEGVVRLFLLGGEGAGEQGRLQQKALESESLKHHDILQQDFLDTYYNLTAKTLMGLNWVARRCPRASFVMKTDGDVFVNTEYLVRKLLRLEPGTENYITGKIHWNEEPVRDKSSKWYVSKEERNSTYPFFISGGGYVFSGDLAWKVSNASLGVPRFRLEDVHVALRLAELGVEPTEPLAGEFNLEDQVPWSYHAYSHLVMSHAVSPNDMVEYWSRLQKGFF